MGQCGPSTRRGSSRSLGHALQTKEIDLAAGRSRPGQAIDALERQSPRKPRQGRLNALPPEGALAFARDDGETTGGRGRRKSRREARELLVRPSMLWSRNPLGAEPADVPDDSGAFVVPAPQKA